MPTDDEFDEYTEAFDAVYAAMHDAALIANTTAAITPPVLYQALGNLRAAIGALTEILPSLTRSARTAADGLDLQDSEGGDPQQQFDMSLATLEEAARSAQTLLAQLNTAQSQIGSVGYRG